MKTSLALLAKEVREKLKEAFPDCQFSVRSRSYSGGGSIDVEYTDFLPVEKITKAIYPVSTNKSYSLIITRKYSKDYCWLLCNQLDLRTKPLLIDQLVNFEKVVNALESKITTNPNGSIEFFSSDNYNEYQVKEVTERLTNQGYLVKTAPIPAGESYFSFIIYG